MQVVKPTFLCSVKGSIHLDFKDGYRSARRGITHYLLKHNSCSVDRGADLTIIQFGGAGSRTVMSNGLKTGTRYPQPWWVFRMTKVIRPEDLHTDFVIEIRCEVLKGYN